MFKSKGDSFPIARYRFFFLITLLVYERLIMTNFTVSFSSGEAFLSTLSCVCQLLLEWQYHCRHFSFAASGVGPNSVEVESQVSGEKEKFCLKKKEKTSESIWTSRNAAFGGLIFLLSSKKNIIMSMFLQ